MVAKFKRIKKRGQVSSKLSLIAVVFLDITLLTIVGFLVFLNFDIKERREKITAQARALSQRLQELKVEKEELLTEISQASSEQYLEKRLREDLNLKKPGEQVMAFHIVKQEESKNTLIPEEAPFWQKILEKIGLKQD